MRKNIVNARLTAALMALSAFALGALWLRPAHAAELQALSWQDDGAIHMRLAGEVAQEKQVLEDGRRLRIRLPDTTLGGSVGELAGRDNVKGVYPYVADNGKAVFVDVLLNEPADMRVEKASDGLTLKTAAAATVAEPDTATQAAEGQTAADANVLEDITYTKLPGDRLQIKLKTSRAPEQPSTFTINNPARISLDMANTKVAMPRRNVKIGVGAVNNVVAVEGEGRSRVVLNLVRPVAYAAHVLPDGISIVVENPADKIAAAAQPRTTHFAAAAKPGKHRLENIDFRRGAHGEGKIVIDLSDPGIGINIQEQAGEILVDFLDTGIASEMQQRLDVIDFATPIQTIDTFVVGKNTRMVVKPKGRYEHLAYQAADVFTIDVKPVVTRPEDEKKVDEFGYSGEKLSLNFQNIDVRAALQVIADFTNLNFVTSDTVKGNLTLRLKDVPWDQALDIVVNAKNLAVRRKGNVVMVAPADEVAAKEKANLEAGKAALDLEPLLSELIQVNYAKASDIAALLKSIKAVAGAVPQQVGRDTTVSIAKVETESNSLLSPRGQVTVDARTNSILVQDTAAKIREIRKLIAKLDQPIRQVMIEARLVEAREEFSKSLGVRFGTQNTMTSDGFQLDQTGALVGNTGFNANLPTFGAAGSIGLTIAKLGTGSLLSLELTALEENNHGKVISSPRIITASQKKARIEQGQEDTIALVDGVETKKAVLALEVTPQITPDDRIILDVDITKDNFVEAGDLRMNTKRMNTQVLLDNGETVVIGGVYEQNERSSRTQVPFFGNLPLLGWMFRTKGVRDEKTELLIFLTPRILSPQLNLQ